jgi:hypothetical protein
MDSIKLPVAEDGLLVKKNCSLAEITQWHCSGSDGVFETMCFKAS